VIAGLLFFVMGVALLCLLHWLTGGFVHKPPWLRKRRKVTGEDTK